MIHSEELYSLYRSPNNHGDQIIELANKCSQNGRILVYKFFKSVNS